MMISYRNLLDRLEALLDSGCLPQCVVFRVGFVRLVLAKKAFIHYQYSGMLAEHLGFSRAEVLRALLIQYNPDLWSNLVESGLINQQGDE